MLGQKPRTVSIQSSCFCLLGKDEGAQESFWRSPNTLADLQKALWMCCVILDMFPILTGLDCYRLFSEVYGSDRLLGLPCLLYLIRVSSAIQKTLPFTQTSSTTPRLLHWPPATFLSAMGTPTEAYRAMQLASTQYPHPLAWCSRPLKVWPPFSGTKHAATPDPED